MYSYAIKILEKEIAKQYEELRNATKLDCAHDDVRITDILYHRQNEIKEVINGLVGAAELLKGKNRIY